MASLQKVKVYVAKENKYIFAEWQSNQTLLVSPGKLYDSDRTMLEDARGYRYTRRIDLEAHTDKQVFIML
jgi:hypothetical protein